MLIDPKQTKCNIKKMVEAVVLIPVSPSDFFCTWYVNKGTSSEALIIVADRFLGSSVRVGMPYPEWCVRHVT